MPAPTPPVNPAPRRRRRGMTRNALAVYGTTAALFVTTFGFLGLRVAEGHDPAVSAQTTARVATSSAATTTANTATTTTAAVQQAPVQTSTS